MINQTAQTNQSKWVVIDILQQLREGHKGLLLAAGQVLFNRQEVQMILNVNQWNGEVGRAVIKEKLREIYRYYEERDKNCIGKTLKIKAYARAVLSSITANHYFDGSQYLKAMLDLIQSKDDIENALYFLFRTKSLSSLISYDKAENKQFKYDLTTQALFYYILSRLKQYSSKEYENQFKSIYFRLDPLPNRILKAVNEHMRYKQVDPLTKNVLSALQAKQKQIIEDQHQNNHSHRVEQVLDFLVKQDIKWSRMRDYIHKDRNSPHYDLIMRHLASTRLVQKALMQRQRSTNPSHSPAKIYNTIRQGYYEKNRSLQWFKKCEIGGILQKYSQRSKRFSQKYVRLGDDGIFQSNQQGNCKLKYEWKQITKVNYGNPMNETTYHPTNIQSDHIFSLALRSGSVDFACQNQQERRRWVQAIRYMLNNKQREQSSIKKTISTSGIVSQIQTPCSSRMRVQLPLQKLKQKSQRCQNTKKSEKI